MRRGGELEQHEHAVGALPISRTVRSYARAERQRRPRWRLGPNQWVCASVAGAAEHRSHRVSLGRKSWRKRPSLVRTARDRRAIVVSRAGGSSARRESSVVTPFSTLDKARAALMEKAVVIARRAGRLVPRVYFDRDG